MLNTTSIEAPRALTGLQKNREKYCIQMFIQTRDRLFNHHRELSRRRKRRQTCW